MATVPLNSPTGRWVMASVIMASAMAFIDGTALNVVLPSLQRDLNASGTDLFWILNAYLLILAALILVGGSLGDKLGRKKIFMTGILIFIIGSTACGFAPTVTYLIGFRLAQGVGGALMIPGSLSLLSSSIDEKERGKAIGTWSAITTVVTMGGPVIGGALADAGLWRYIFFINVPIGLAALLILHRYVAESRGENNNPAPTNPNATTPNNPGSDQTHKSKSRFPRRHRHRIRPRLPDLWLPAHSRTRLQQLDSLSHTRSRHHITHILHHHRKQKPPTHDAPAPVREQEL